MIIKLIDSVEIFLLFKKDNLDKLTRLDEISSEIPPMKIWNTK